MDFSQKLKSGGIVLGLGIDLTEVERIRTAHERHGKRFLQKVYTQGELDYCLALPDPYPALTARFAAKEAVAKAFGTGIGEYFGLHSASVAKDALGAPVIELDALGQTLLAKQGGTGVLISLTHTRTLAQAIAAIVRGDVQAAAYAEAR